jgi:hypothetical protein
VGTGTDHLDGVTRLRVQSLAARLEEAIALLSGPMVAAVPIEGVEDPHHEACQTLRSIEIRLAEIASSDRTPGVVARALRGMRDGLASHLLTVQMLEHGGVERHVARSVLVRGATRCHEALQALLHTPNATLVAQPV